MNINVQNFLILSLISFVSFQCSSKKNGVGDILGLFFILQEKADSEEEAEKVSVDFSDINEDLHDVLGYKSSKDKNSSSVVQLSLSDAAKDDGWEEIPSSKKVEIEKDHEVELSLGGVVSLGKKKITSDTTLTLVSVMGTADKVKNFKYLALSLSSVKTGTLTITTQVWTDLKTKLATKNIDFSKSYTDFKADPVVADVLTDKAKANDAQVNAYSTEKKSDSSDDPKKIILWSYVEAKRGGDIGGKTHANTLCANATKHPQSIKNEKLTTHKAFLTFQNMGDPLPFWPFPKSFTGANDKIPNSDTRPLYGEDGTTKVANSYNDYFDLSKNALSSLKAAGVDQGTRAADPRFLFGINISGGDFTMGQGSCGDNAGGFWNTTAGTSAFGGLLDKVDDKRFYTTGSPSCDEPRTLLCVSY